MRQDRRRMSVKLPALLLAQAMMVPLPSSKRK